MSKKLLTIIFTTFLLSGCTLIPKDQEAARDVALPTPAPIESSLPLASLAPADINEISAFEKSQVTSTNTDLESLEKDLNYTLIPEEDLSDIFGE